MKRYKIKPYKSYRRRRSKRKVAFIMTFLILAVMAIFAYMFSKKGMAHWGVALKRDTQNDKESFSLKGYIARPKTDYFLYSEPIKVKGIYVSGNRAGSVEIDKLIDLCNRTEVNAMVIDVKTDDGTLTFSMDHPMLKEAGVIPDNVLIKDISYLMNKLYENNIYPIARIITFKDNMIKNTYPEFALKNKDGSIYQSSEPGGKSTTWLNPYNKDVWEYILTIAKEAAKVGFKEIQFDYIRFHEGTNKERIDFGSGAEGKDKMQIISEFTKYAVEELHKQGVYVSVDVFGAIITSKIDAEIVGQDYTQLSRYVDYICPMIYPSHYAEGSFGVQHPDLQPYEIILNSMEASRDRLREIKNDEHCAIVRPWLQDFTAKWIPVHQAYGPDEIRKQIQGVYDAGLYEWILWSASNIYTEDGLLAE